MIDLNVNKFHLVKGVPLRCLFIFKLPKTIIFKSENIFYFKLILSLCVVLNKIERLGKHIRILDMLHNCSKVFGVILQ
jgi:hypothetical protein